jgi:hypothetical protein
MAAIDGSDDGQDQASEYQSLTPLAALAVLLGILSPAALASPLLLVVPAAAIGAGLLALAKIRASGEALSGAGLARWGLALGLACIVATFVRDPVRDGLLRRQTNAVAREWLALLAEGRTSDALLLLTPGAVQALGPAPSGPMQEPPKPEDVRTIVLEKLRSDPLSRRLAGMKGPLTVRSSADDRAESLSESGRTMLPRELTVSPADESAPCRVSLRFARGSSLAPDGGQWRIENWSLHPDAEPEDAESPDAAPSRSS